MTIRHLKIYVAVYEEMSITKAADKLFLAQPSVSLAIKEMEEYYGVKLFERINRRLFVTEKGEELYYYASHIMDMYEEMDVNIKSEQVLKRLSIGSSITIGNYIVPKLMAEFNGRFPDCRINVIVQNSEHIVQAVANNELDIGLVEGRVKDEHLVVVPFMSDQLYFVSGKEHPLTSKKKVTLEDICSYPLYLREPGSAGREITDGLLKSYQMGAEITYESVSNQALLAAIEYNNGITVLPEKIIENQLTDGKIAVLSYHPDAFFREFVLIYHKKKYVGTELEYLINTVVDGGNGNL